MYCFRPGLHQEGAAQREGGRQLSWDESTWAETAGGWSELNFVETTGVLLLFSTCLVLVCYVVQHPKTSSFLGLNCLEM